jgi:hypothetical protein
MIIRSDFDTDFATRSLRRFFMEALIRLLDDAEDTIIFLALSLRRQLARRPRERRRVARLSENTLKPSSASVKSTRGF